MKYFRFTLILLILLLTGCSTDKTSTNIEVVRGLSWEISKKKSLQILKDRYNLELHEDKTTLKNEADKDKGEFIIFETYIDGFMLDLTLRFVDDKLIEIQYNYSTSLFDKQYYIYKTLYEKVLIKYGKPICYDSQLDCEEANLLSFLQLKERVEKQSNDRKDWYLKSLKTNITLDAFYSFVEEDNKLCVTLNYSFSDAFNVETDKI